MKEVLLDFKSQEKKETLQECCLSIKNEGFVNVKVENAEPMDLGLFLQVLEEKLEDYGMFVELEFNRIGDDMVKIELIDY
jgi:hypothetical protein